LEAELAQAGAGPVVVLGFSQGGAMALEAALALPVAAIISCSGYPHAGGLRLPDTHRATPSVLLLHGRHDPVVPAAALGQLQQDLQAAGVPVEAVLFSGEHAIPAEAVDAMASFLGRIIATAGV
jgi:phospholipase/carboxylesterase